jgi:hypothetical protein
MGCVSSTNFAILINGEASKFFISGRGLHQGCPLSPLIFILVMEGLSLALKKSHLEGKLSGIQVSRLIRIIHPLFVDDVIIRSKVDINEWREIHTLLSAFCGASGLEINAQKSTFHHFVIQQAFLDQLNVLFHFGNTCLTKGFKYLGYFLKLDSL